MLVNRTGVNMAEYHNEECEVDNSMITNPCLL